MKNKIIRTTILGICEDSYNNKGVFATSDPEYHKVCEDLVSEGLILETTTLHMDNGAADRCFNLTINGLRELGLIK
jgi:hypothetical protein